MLQADLTEPSFERPSEMVILIEPAGPTEVRLLRTPPPALSPPEREIVDLLVRGVPRNQIAASLYISEYTVQEHLSNIFDKVHVRGRQALVKHLYLDTAFP